MSLTTRAPGNAAGGAAAEAPAPSLHSLGSAWASLGSNFSTELRAGLASQRYRGSAGGVQGLESRARGSGRGSCPVPLLMCLEQKTRSHAANTCSCVRAVAIVCEQPTWPGQQARTEPGIQVTVWEMPPGPASSQSQTHVPVSHRDFSRCQSRPWQEARVQLSLPCAPGSLCLPFHLLVMWQPLLWPLGKGKCC